MRPPTVLISGHARRYFLAAGARAVFAVAAVAARGLPQKTFKPRSDGLTISIAPSLFKSTANMLEPHPEWLWISSGTNSAPPGAFGFRTVRYKYRTGTP